MDDRISKILDYIEENLSLNLRLSDLADIACLSPSQFHRVFKKETNKTPFRFIEEIKLNKAHQLLLEGNVLVWEIAQNLGYNDYETFSRAFKKCFHISPDDLKSISDKVREDPNVDETDKIFILASDVENEDELIEELKSMLKNKNISTRELKETKVFKIDKGKNSKQRNKTLIKNKYRMTSSKKIWKELIKAK